MLQRNREKSGEEWMQEQLESQMRELSSLQLKIIVAVTREKDALRRVDELEKQLLSST